MPARAQGQVIETTGRVLDLRGQSDRGRGAGAVAGQCGRALHARSRPRHRAARPRFPGLCARLVTGAVGDWRIVTVKPGSYDSPIGQRTPHIHSTMQGRSHRTNAQLYFPDEAERTRGTCFIAQLGEEAGTSVAARDPDDPGKYRWDIVLMG